MVRIFQFVSVFKCSLTKEMSISEKQKEIIDAAGKFLTQTGISGGKTKNLAKERGFSEAAIFRHFPSEEGIIA